MNFKPYSKTEALAMESATVKAINKKLSQHAEVASVWTMENDEMKLLAAGEDVYEAIGTQGTVRALAQGQPIVAVTYGWAAPFSPDELEVPPSEHPDRIRVSLLIMFSTSNFISVLRRDGEKEPDIADVGEANGSLLECVTHYARLAVSRNN